MKLVQLTKDMAHQGLSEGDVLSVDERSAKALIDRGDAAEYKPPTEGAKKEETIDDIPSTANRGRAVMSAVRVGSADPGPVAATVAEAEDAPAAEADAAGPTPAPTSQPQKRSPKSGPAASGAQPAGGDAGGGASTE
jgi:hypothetical protein